MAHDQQHLLAEANFDWQKRPEFRRWERLLGPAYAVRLAHRLNAELAQVVVLMMSAYDRLRPYTESAFLSSFPSQREIGCIPRAPVRHC